MDRIRPSAPRRRRGGVIAYRSTDAKPRSSKKHDILCKVNTVLIPGVNDDHITELHEKISSKGVFIHNIMPLISAPEYGTYFGKIGQRGPTDQELESVRNSLPGGARLMRHCKQCRADAVGMLEKIGAASSLCKSWKRLTQHRRRSRANFSYPLTLFFESP